MTRKFLLAADVGGTKTEIVLAAPGDNWPGITGQRIYASREFAGLEPLLADFLGRPEIRAQSSAISAACFSVAGAVEDERTTLTNLGWGVSATELRERFKFPAVRLINDFAAAGLGITRLAPGDLETLQAGQTVLGGTRVIIGAGTGLGVAILTWDKGGYTARASEAGHADFAPLDELQDGLLASLRRAFGRVSYERVISGPGLTRIFNYLKDAGLGTPSAAMLDALTQRIDTAEAIAELGMSRRDPLAVTALDLFVTAYGAFAGNIALALLARGGVYIAGGIAPKLAAKLEEGAFVRAFSAKGRFSPLLSTIPVHVVMNARVGLYGALDVAGRLARAAGRRKEEGGKRKA